MTENSDWTAVQQLISPKNFILCKIYPRSICLQSIMLQFDFHVSVLIGTSLWTPVQLLNLSVQ